MTASTPMRGGLLVAAVLVALSSARLVAAEKDLAQEEAKLMEKYEKLLLSDARVTPDSDTLDLLQGFERLSDMLLFRVPDSDDAVANIRAAAEYLDENQSDARLNKAAEVFVQLRKLTDDNAGRVELMCSAASESILRLNYRIAAALESERRVPVIVRRLSAEHAQECLPQYPKKFAATMSRVASEPLLGILTNDFIVGFVSEEPSVFIELMQGNEPSAPVDTSWRSKLTTELASELKEITAGTEDEFCKAAKGKGRSVVLDRPKFGRAYAKLVKKACDDYLELTGDIFRAARFDMGNSNASLLKSELTDDDTKFAFGLFRFEVCKVILADPKASLETAVMKAINS